MLLAVWENLRRSERPLLARENYDTFPNALHDHELLMQSLTCFQRPFFFVHFDVFRHALSSFGGHFTRSKMSYELLQGNLTLVRRKPLCRFKRSTVPQAFTFCFCCSSCNKTSASPPPPSPGPSCPASTAPPPQKEKKKEKERS